MVPNTDPYLKYAFWGEQELIPLLPFLIRHPVIIPPMDKLDNTYKLKDEKNPVTRKSELNVSNSVHSKNQPYRTWSMQAI